MEYSRRKFLARGIELASTIPLIGVLFSNFANARDYNQVNTDSALLAEKPASVGKLVSVQTPFVESLSNLSNEYRQAYHHSHSETYLSTDSKGRITTKTRTVWRWEEPKNVPNHNTVLSWNNWHNNMYKKANNLYSSNVIDLRKVDEMKVERKQESRVLQGVISSIMYGGEIALLLGYEEIAAAMNQTEKKEMTRRSFFKVGAALAGAGVGYFIMDRNKKQAREDLEKVGDKVIDLSKLKDNSPEEGFRRYFGTMPAEMINSAQGIINTGKSTLEGGIKEMGVRTSLENVVRTGEDYVEDMHSLFSEGIPKELGETATGAYLLEEAEAISSGQRLKTTGNILLEGLAIGGTMAAILIPAELINKTLTE